MVAGDCLRCSSHTGGGPCNHIRRTRVSSKYLIKNASISTFWRTFGIVSGAVLDAIILARFGLGAETDALFASLAIPVLITSALDLQAPKILVPALTRCAENEGAEAAHELVKILIT